MILLLSCKHRESADNSFNDVVWKDLDSLTNHSKNYLVCEIDSTWTSRTTHPVDTNFIKANMLKIDYNLFKHNILNERGGDRHDFYLLDTLKNETSAIFIILLGKYHFAPAPQFYDQRHLFLLAISNNKVITSYHLAQTRSNMFQSADNIKTSIILPGVMIISRNIFHFTSDNIVDNIQESSKSIETYFNTYDPQLLRFVPYKKPIFKTVHYKTKLN